MSIQKIDGVKINGKNKAFGGYVYNVDVQIGLGQTPTKITINFINESGDYIKPILSATAPYQITIGNIFSGSFYAISSKRVNSSSGKLFVVSFWDGSIALDRLWVGLHKRMGDKNSNNVSNLILVGTERHPCDVNKDGVYDELDKEELVYDSLDNCELMCPGDQNPEDRIVADCDSRSFYDILEVDYSFSDLIEAIKEKINVGKYPDINKNYFAKYTGKLRDVLSSWCADFGWTFYWEGGALNFMDTSVQPVINFDILGCLQSESEEETIEGTISRGLISHYGEKGIWSQKECSYERQMGLNCLTLKDLYGDFYYPSSPSYHNPKTDSTDSTPATQAWAPISKTFYVDSVYPQGVPIESFEISSALAYYSQELRNIFNFYYYYGITDFNTAQGLEGKSLSRYGKMKILKVFNPKNPIPLFQEKVESLFFSDVKTQTESKNVVSKKKFTDKGGFYMLVKIDINELNAQYEQEEYLAKEFIGQHWYYAYQDVHYGADPQVAGGGQYFGALSIEPNEIPFSKFDATPGSKVSNLFATFSKKQKAKFRNYNSDLGIDSNSEKTLVKSLLYYKKNSIWNPINGVPSPLSSLLESEGFSAPTMKDATDILFEISGKGNLYKFGVDTGDFPEHLNDKNKAPNGYYFLAVFPNSLNVSTSTEQNPYEEDPSYSPSSSNGVTGDTQKGLTSKDCIAITINGAKIYTPAGALSAFGYPTVFNWMDYSISDGKPQYIVFVTATTSGAGSIPKTESTLISDANPSDSSLSVEYTVKELSKDSLRYIAKLTPSCRFDASLLKEEHEKLHDKSVFSVNGPLKSKRYSIFGVTIPSTIKIKDGLQDLQVRIDDKGIMTEIGIGNSKFTPPSQDYLTKDLEYYQYSQLSNARPNPI